MFTIEKGCVRLKAAPRNREEAIRLAGSLLAEAGYIDPAYVDSMIERENTAHTYIGGGIAIPHGLPKNRDRIKKTGVSIVQVPDGVIWQGEDRVHTVLGIAAASDEHIEVLRHITHLIDDADALAKLRTLSDADEVIRIITGAKEKEQSAPADLSSYTHSSDCRIIAGVGLHARPASVFVETAKHFKSEVLVRCGERFASGTSIAGLLKLGSAGGSLLTIFAKGEDADEAVRTLAVAVDSGLGDEDEAEQVALSHSWIPESAAFAVKGLPASGGIAIAPVRFYKKAKADVTKEGKGKTEESALFSDALAKAKAELDSLYASMKSGPGASRAAIFKAHIGFLEDEETLGEAREGISRGESAAWAWKHAFEKNAHALESLSDATLAARAADVRDAGERVLRHLTGKGASSPVFDSPCILVTDDLSPSDTAQLDVSIVKGFCTSAGAPTSHSAITARSLGIPAVVGCGEAVYSIDESMIAVLDGVNGCLYAGLSETDIDAARALQETLRKQSDTQHVRRFEPAVTRDGIRIEIAANIASVDDASRAAESGAEGIGLMRSEFLFLERDSAPDEEEQYEAYCRILAAMNGLPVIIRTLDIGGDKHVPYLDLPREENPFLGVRGLRLCLERKDLFRTQLRAIYRASKKGPLKIMFPMVAVSEELVEARLLCDEIRAEVGAAEVPIGIMIEVPSAAVFADELAKHADFFSIGTNDLTQYLFAMDRLNPSLASKADALHPAVLRVIDRVVAAGLRRGIPTGVCGGIAGDPLGSLILAGLGVKELSVSIPSIPQIKAVLREGTFARAARLASAALARTSAEHVRRLA